MSSNSYCPYCGSENKPGDVFCNNCGASLEKQPSAPAQTSYAPQQTGYTPPAQQPYSQPQYGSQSYVPPPQQPQYGTQYGTQPMYTPQPAYPIEKNQAADLALTFGVIGLFFTIMAIPAIILGIIGATKQYNRSKAIWGIVLGVCEIGLIPLIILWQFW